MGNLDIHVGDLSIEPTHVANYVSMYNITVSIIRDTKVNSSEGMSKTPVVIAGPLRGYIKWMKGKEKLLLNKQTHLLDGTLYCRIPAGITIVETDRILYNSKYYEIVNVEDVNNLGILYIISIKKIK